MSLDIIPTEHIITDKAQELIKDAVLYENAGLEAMGNDKKYEALKDVCKASDIEIIIMNGDRVSVKNEEMLYKKYDWYEWRFVYVDKYKGDVPINLRLKMSKIKDKKGLAILYKKYTSDPVLLYNTGLRHPDSYEKVFIKIDEWE